MFFTRTRTEMVSRDRALKGRDSYAFTVPATHYVSRRPIRPPFPDGLQQVVFALGCFWGAERTFWQTPGVWTTAVGYAGGYTPYPTYDEVCSGLTGHTESVLVVFDPAAVGIESLLSTFFQAHDPSQGMRQGNDIGTQYRSAIYASDAGQLAVAQSAKAAYSTRLRANRYGDATTEIALRADGSRTDHTAGSFYYAEGYHQQYLAKNPHGYCPDHGTGVSCPVGLFATVTE